MSDERIDPKVIETAHKAFWDAYDPPGDSLPLDVENVAIEAAIHAADRERGLRRQWALANERGIVEVRLIYGSYESAVDRLTRGNHIVTQIASDWRQVERGGEDG